MKSAWEKALEKLDNAGIERPNPANVTDELRTRLDAVRNKSAASLAELQIMYKKSIESSDPTEHQDIENNYRRDRERIESKRDRELQNLRS